MRAAGGDGGRNGSHKKDSISDFGKTVRRRSSLTVKKNRKTILQSHVPIRNQTGKRRDRYMAEVLQFRKPDDGDEDSWFEHRSSRAYAAPPKPVQISEAGVLCAQAKEDIRTLILMFDVALMHGRLAVLKMDDPDNKPRLEAHLRAIEEMLDVARVKAARL